MAKHWSQDPVFVARRRNVRRVAGGVLVGASLVGVAAQTVATRNADERAARGAVKIDLVTDGELDVYAGEFHEMWDDARRAQTPGEDHVGVYFDAYLAARDQLAYELATNPEIDDPRVVDLRQFAPVGHDVWTDAAKLIGATGQSTLTEAEAIAPDLLEASTGTRGIEAARNQYYGSLAAARAQARPEPSLEL